MPRSSRRVSLLSIVAVLVAGSWVTVAMPAASAAGCWGAYGSPVGDNALFYGAGSLGEQSTWAVGGVGSSTLVKHWDGCTWKRQTSEDVTGDRVNGSWLTSVSAVSPSFQWAVGAYVDLDIGYRSFIERGNGSTWSIVTSPTLVHYSFLEFVDALLGGNAWADGNYYNGSTFLTLMDHWDGTSWKRQNTPNPGSQAGFKGVSAVAANNVWAAGTYTNVNNVGQTLIEHWNGSQWKVVPSPNKVGPHNYNSLDGIFMLSATNGWAVGEYNNANGKAQTLILHWNGSRWTISNSPNPGGGLQGNNLNGIVATSPGNAWAVGEYTTASIQGKALVEHWDGKTWAAQPVALPAGTTLSGLIDITATSATNAWSVGDYYDSNGEHLLGLHCC